MKKAKHFAGLAGLLGVAGAAVLVTTYLKKRRNTSIFGARTDALSCAKEMIENNEADCVVLQDGVIAKIKTGHGVRPLLEMYEEEPDLLRGSILVDKVVGKAVAIMAVLSGVQEVYGLTSSDSAAAFLALHGIPLTSDVRVEAIQNRTGTGICPLEASVLEINDCEEGYRVLKDTVARLAAEKHADTGCAVPTADTAPESMEDCCKKIKPLGFGLMRLPMLENGDVDIEQTKQMVDLFLSKGFTYFDTAYGYINGKSEAAVKTCLVDRYPRSSFLLATKLPAWAGPKTAEEAKNMFWTSLQRTGAEYFDFYLLHNLGDNRTKCFDDFGIWDFVAEQKKKGLIRHLGFSFHDKAAVLDELLTLHPEVDFVQLQINYADWDSPTVESRKCYETARRHGKPVVIMEPVKGGSLASLPEQLTTIFKTAAPGASLASWAIRYAASLEGLVTVLSGMSTLEQMQDNLSFMENFKPLSPIERTVIENVQHTMAELPHVPCTGCSYCTKGCPQQIAIPGIFSAMNTYLQYGNMAAAKGNYAWATHEGGLASKCIGCGQCETVCPQHISVIDELKRAASTLEG